MYMKDGIETLDGFLKPIKHEILTGARRISAAMAKKKAKEEFRYVSFMCNNYSRSGKSTCSVHSISKRKLKTLVLEDIKDYARLANEDAD